MSWTIQHVAPQPREGGSKSASIRGKTSGRIRPRPTYSRPFPPTAAKKFDNTITDSYFQPIRINEQSQPFPSQSDLVGASGTYWDSKKRKNHAFFRSAGLQTGKFPRVHVLFIWIRVYSCPFVVQFLPLNRTILHIFRDICTYVHQRALASALVRQKAKIQNGAQTAQNCTSDSTCTYLHQVAPTCRKKNCAHTLYDTKIVFSFSL